MCRGPPALSLGEQVDAELARFYAEPSLRLKITVNGKGHFNCPLKWWQQREPKFPIISRVAKALLCITATSAPSERAFSSAGLTIANHRAGMHGDNAAAMIFLRSALPVIERFELQEAIANNP